MTTDAPVAVSQTSTALPEELLARLAPLREQLHGPVGNAVVPFVGSGLSRELPSWEDLLRRMAEFLAEPARSEIREEIARGKLIPDSSGLPAR